MPPWSPKDIYTGEFSKTVSGVWPPIGHLCSLAATLIEKGNNVEIIDGSFFNLNEILNKVFNSHAEFIGIYTNAFLWKSAITTINGIKKIVPKVHISIGGPFATALKQKCFVECDQIDTLLFGEGDYSITELVDCLKNKKPLSDVLGLIYKDKDGLN